MKFQSLTLLRQNLESKDVFHNEIKGKRLRKQIQGLQEIQCENFTFKQFQVSDVAILMYIEASAQAKTIQLVIRLDYQYPFSPPQIFYTGNQYRHNGYCKDLLKVILKDQLWGPSFTLPFFLQKIQMITHAITKKTEIAPIYHKHFQYNKYQLEKYGVKLIDAEEYEWKYWIKMTSKRSIGLADDTFLVFDKLSQNTFKLVFWIPVSEFTEVKADKGKNKFQLSLNYVQDQKRIKLYYGGDSEAIDEILQVINPIEMTERKIIKMEKQGIKDHDEAIKLYTKLIQHYSLTKPQLMNKYVQNMKKTIKEQYENNQKSQKAPQMVEIQT